MKSYYFTYIAVKVIWIYSCDTLFDRKAYATVAIHCCGKVWEVCETRATIQKNIRKAIMPLLHVLYVWIFQCIIRSSTKQSTLYSYIPSYKIVKFSIIKHEAKILLYSNTLLQFFFNVSTINAALELNQCFVQNWCR